MSLLAELIDAYRTARQPLYRAAVKRSGLPLGEGHVWGLARISYDDHFYEPCSRGELALITGAYEGGELFDLVAVSPPTFGMRTRRGEACFLGIDALDEARWHKRPLKLYADACSWLRHGRSGAVILDWRGVAFRLADMPSIVCETEALGERVSAAFAQPLPLPPVYFPSSQETDHAR